MGSRVPGFLHERRLAFPSTFLPRDTDCILRPVRWGVVGYLVGRGYAPPPSSVKDPPKPSLDGAPSKFQAIAMGRATRQLWDKHQCVERSFAARSVKQVQPVLLEIIEFLLKVWLFRGRV